MKKLNILFIAIVLMSGLTVHVNAQVLISPSPRASVTLKTPLSISKSSDLDFGNIQVGITAGTVTLSPAIITVRSKSGGVTFPAVSGTVSSASFTVRGNPAATFAITLPSSYIISSGANTMSVTTFTSYPSGAGLLSGLGSQIIYVGAILNVNAGQPGGVYTNGAGFGVTVIYN